VYSIRVALVEKGVELLIVDAELRETTAEPLTDERRQTRQQGPERSVLVDECEERPAELLDLLVVRGRKKFYAGLEVLDVLLLAMPEFTLRDAILYLAQLLCPGRIPNSFSMAIRKRGGKTKKKQDSLWIAFSFGRCTRLVSAAIVVILGIVVEVVLRFRRLAECCRSGARCHG
jgi:hypothetical protein